MQVKKIMIAAKTPRPDALYKQLHSRLLISRTLPSLRAEKIHSSFPWIITGTIVISDAARGRGTGGAGRGGPGL